MLENATPLFLLGSPRSGTTALSRYLDIHPQVIQTNETAVFLQLNELVSKSPMGIQAGIMYGKEYGQLWSEHIAGHSRALITGFYEKIAQTEGRLDIRYFGDKHPHYAHTLDFMDRLYPDAKYIYIVRDPRDAGCSMADMSQTDFTKALENWMIFVRKHETFVERLDSGRIMTIQYEDMVTDVQATVEKLAQWLGLIYETDAMDRINKLQNIDAHSKKRRQDFAARSINRWKNELDDDQVKFTEERAKAFMEKYGYNGE